MQDLFSLVPATTAAIEATVSADRLGRYLPAANGDPHFALRLYIWNARLCEAFYLPIQLAEVACRNAVAKALVEHYGIHWHQDDHFRSILPARLREELANVSARERSRLGGGMAGHHVISGLTFGFWVHLLTKGFDFILWKNGIARGFPGAPAHIQRADIHLRIEKIRLYRNRIAHHDAIFDKGPSAAHANILTVAGWICQETRWLMTHLSRVPRTVNVRPRS